MGFLSLSSAKRRSPSPSTTGKNFSRSSSTRSCSSSVRRSWKLATTTISPFSSCFSFETSSTASLFSTVELFQSGSSRVEDTTYLAMLFSLSANSPLRDGHRAANHSVERDVLADDDLPHFGSPYRWRCQKPPMETPECWGSGRRPTAQFDRRSVSIRVEVRQGCGTKE